MVENKINEIETPAEPLENEQSLFDYTEEKIEPIKPAKKKKQQFGVVGCDQLNLREEPSTDSDILYILNKGETVTLIDDDTVKSSGKFCKVLANGVVGYCVKEFIELK